MRNLGLALAVGVLFLSACSSSRVDETGATDSTSGSTDYQSGEQSAVTDALPPVSDLPPPPDVPGDSPVQENVDVAMTPPPAPESLPVAPAAPEMATTDVPPPPPVAETPAPSESALAPTPLDAQQTDGIASAPEPVSGDFERYTVRSGDTLMKIAFEHYGDLYRWREIFENNRQALASSEKLEKGTELRLSTLGKRKIERKGLRYLIQPGDTLGKASHHIYGTPKRWRKLWEFNRDLVKDPNKIYAGFNLVYKPFRRLASTRQ